MIVLQFIILAVVALFGVMHMTTLAQLAEDLTAVKDQAAKAKAEIIAKIAALEEAIANGGGTTPEVDAALAALKAEVQGIDDVVPDSPTP